MKTDEFQLARELFNLDDSQIESFDIRQTVNELQLHVRLLRKECECPICRTGTDKIKGYTPKRITHSALTNRKCVIIYQARRYVCPCCNKTFYEPNPFVFNHMKVSILTVKKVLDDLKKPNETFTSVAQRYSISPTTASQIFDRHVRIPRRALPQYLCIDEVYAFSSKDSDYVCVLVDFETLRIVDILPSRKKSDLINYFDKIPRKERENVKVLSSDMWESYRIVGKMVFPNAVHSVDKFHILAELSRQVDSVRLEVMNANRVSPNLDKKNLTVQEEYQYRKKDINYYLLKKFNWLLYKNDPKYSDPNQERVFNKKLGRYLNFYDIGTMILAIDDRLSVAVDLKYDLEQFFKNSDYSKAEDDLNGLIKDFESSGVVQMERFARTLKRWKREIVNSFIEVKGPQKRKINNGVCENRNKSIKLIKHNSNGYGQWERFRNRVLYSLNDDEVPYLMPFDIKKKKSDEK